MANMSRLQNLNIFLILVAGAFLVLLSSSLKVGAGEAQSSAASTADNILNRAWAQRDFGVDYAELLAHTFGRAGHSALLREVMRGLRQSDSAVGDGRLLDIVSRVLADTGDTVSSELNDTTCGLLRRRKEREMCKREIPPGFVFLLPLLNASRILRVFPAYTSDELPTISDRATERVLLKAMVQKAVHVDDRQIFHWEVPASIDHNDPHDLFRAGVAAGAEADKIKIPPPQKGGKKLHSSSFHLILKRLSLLQLSSFQYLGSAMVALEKREELVEHAKIAEINERESGEQEGEEASSPSFSQLKHEARRKLSTALSAMTNRALAEKSKAELKSTLLDYIDVDKKTILAQHGVTINEVTNDTIATLPSLLPPDALAEVARLVEEEEIIIAEKRRNLCESFCCFYSALYLAGSSFYMSTPPPSCCTSLPQPCFALRIAFKQDGERPSSVYTAKLSGYEPFLPSPSSSSALAMLAREEHLEAHHNFAGLLKDMGRKEDAVHHATIATLASKHMTDTDMMKYIHRSLALRLSGVLPRPLAIAVKESQISSYDDHKEIRYGLCKEILFDYISTKAGVASALRATRPLSHIEEKAFTQFYSTSFSDVYPSLPTPDSPVLSTTLPAILGGERLEACLRELHHFSPKVSDEEEERVQSVLSIVEKDRMGEHARSESNATGESAAILYLCCGSKEEFRELIASLYLLNDNFLSLHGDYPILLFLEEGTYPDGGISQLPSLSSLSVHTFTFPSPPPPKNGTTHEEIEERVYLDEAKTMSFSLGYRQMCRFFSFGFLQNEVIAQYDVIWRIDTDSFLFAPIQHDVFRIFEQSNADYAYLHLGKEAKPFTVGLHDVYAQSGLPLSAYNKVFAQGGDPDLLFYTNFEIIRRKSFLSPDLLSFYRDIDYDGGIFLRRWGDALIRLLAVIGRQPQMRVLHLHDLVPYWHQFVVSYPTKME